MRHLIPISGKDSLATALFMSAHEPKDYEFFYNDNGAELPEVYEWLAKVETVKGWKITRIGSDLTQIIKDIGFLPSPQRRYCTRKSKIEPMEEWIGDDEVTVYYGLRADENRIGYKATKKKITPCYPLMENGINLRGVWAIVSASGLLPPAFEWKALKEAVQAVYPEPEGGYPGLLPWQRHTLFSGRTRPNCTYCFYQKKYEYVWLYDTHPGLFWDACTLEDDTGAEGFTWQEGFRLSEIPMMRDKIINTRVNEVVHILSQGKLFEFDNDLALTSCGLLCGK